MVSRVADYRVAGGLEGKFFAHMEEMDLCWRLRERGKGIMYIPQSVVYHVGGAKLSKENPRKTYLNFRNNLLMLYKNLPANEIKNIMLKRAWMDILAMLPFLLKGDIENFKAVTSARKDYARMKVDYASVRNETLEKTSETIIPERINNSILWQFYAKGHKLFTQLNNLSTPLSNSLSTSLHHLFSLSLSFSRSLFLSLSLSLCLSHSIFPFLSPSLSLSPPPLSTTHPLHCFFPRGPAPRVVRAL